MNPYDYSKEHRLSSQTTEIKLDSEREIKQRSQSTPQNITITETQWPNDEELIVPTTNTIYLSQKIDEFIFKLGYTSVHTVGILLQLLIDGKIRITYKNHTERLELVDDKHLMNRRDALDMFEKYIAKCQGNQDLTEADDVSEKAYMTQKIIVQIPDEARRQYNQRLLDKK
ncbi:MAG: hypothetical protein AAGA18_10435 [Verrucomicrobiota bacterium]